MLPVKSPVGPIQEQSEGAANDDLIAKPPSAEIFTYFINISHCKYHICSGHGEESEADASAAQTAKPITPSVARPGLMKSDAIHKDLAHITKKECVVIRIGNLCSRQNLVESKNDCAPIKPQLDGQTAASRSFWIVSKTYSVI